MISVALGCLSATSLGVADFIASQNSRRIGAARALAGMLLVSSVFLSAYLLVSAGFDGLSVSENGIRILLGSLHGATMAVALLLFFHAMSVGKISVVAPIVAAHPVVIIGFYVSQGAILTVIQLAAIAAILAGVGLVAASEGPKPEDGHHPNTLAKPQTVIALSLTASILYAAAILFLQGAATGLAEVQVLWLGRVVGLATVVAILGYSGTSPLPPSNRWWGILIVHGILDSGGLLFLIWGSDSDTGSAISAVIASTFPVITMGLAWIVLRERIGMLGVAGAAVVVIGVAALASG